MSLSAPNRESLPQDAGSGHAALSCARHARIPGPALLRVYLLGFTLLTLRRIIKNEMFGNYRILAMTPKPAKRPARVVVCLFLAVLAGINASNALGQMPNAKPAGYVNDYAGVLSVSAKQRLEALAAELDRKTGSQLAIVTVNSLQGEPIEDFSIKLATRWGIGRKDKGDTGVLLLLAIQDRQSRMEVGYGIEPIITDGQAGSILRAMRPLLRAGNYDGALLQAAGQIATLIAQAKHVTLTTPLPRPAQQPAGEGQGSPLAGLVWLLFLFFIVPFLMIPRRRRGGWYGGSTAGFILGGILGSMLGGGGRGGGGFSSGGFGGFGGGGFGGGGASSSW
jgi:uncharacterized protein